MFCTSCSLFYSHVRPTVRRAAAANSPAGMLVWLTIQCERGKTKLSRCISRRHRRWALERGGWTAPSSSRINTDKDSQYPSYGGMGGPRAGLNGSGKPRTDRVQPRTIQLAASNYNISDAPFFSRKLKVKFNVNK